MTFQHKTMNGIENTALKLAMGTINGLGTPRENVEEINIFLGIIYIILTLILFLCSLFLFIIAHVIYTIYKFTSSKCKK